MITTDGWLNLAEREPGPADKVYSVPNAVIGYVPHSAVGYYGGWSSRLFSNDRHGDGRYSAYAAVSVHGWIAYDGRVLQHYPLDASCWASGSAYPNTHFVAFENEGGFRPHDEPLTEAQVEANLRLIRELAAWRGWPAVRRPADAADTTASLYEHRECGRWGSAPTACPSGRIPWQRILEALHAPATEAPVSDGAIYVVQPGDSLSAIAAHYGIEWQAIHEANRDRIADPNLLQSGWELRLPAVAVVAPPEPEVYVVRPGDTLYALSRRWGVSVAAIASHNGIDDPRLIRVGQQIVRPE
jgi:LysM repeat protein